MSPDMLRRDISRFIIIIINRRHEPSSVFRFGGQTLSSPLLFPAILPSPFIYRVAQNKIPHRRICNISATSGLILKILEAA